ncbi:MAG: choice-of-anchor D domain-containing protein [Burkholderiales bacterium]
MDFKSTATVDNDVLVSGNNILFLGDRFQSNCLQCANVSYTSTGSAVYFFYDSFTPLVSFYISPPGAGCSEVTPGNLGCTNWPSAGAGANSTTVVEETAFTPGSTSPANANAVNGNKGYEFGININSSAGTLWVDSCDIWGFGNSIVSQTTTAQTTITNTWMHDAANSTEQVYHTDGYGYSNGATAPNNVLLAGNVTGSLGNTQGLALQAATGGYQNIYINENFFSGFNATISFCRPGSVQCTNSTFYGNTFGTDVEDSGAVYSNGSALGTGSVWACNVISVRTGTTWTNLDGWTPTSGENGDYFLNSATASIPYGTTDQGSNTLCAITTPASFNFGNQQSSTTSAGQTVTLKNTNTGTLSSISVSLATGTQFAISSNACGSTLTSGSSCSIVIKFSPTSLGPQTDTLKIADNTSGVTSPQLVPLAGVGITSSVTTPASMPDAIILVNGGYK